MGKTEGNVPPGRPKLRWGNVIMMDFQEVEYRVTYWIAMTQNRDSWRALVKAGMNIRIQ